MPSILATLEASVGAGGYDFIAVDGFAEAFLGDSLDDGGMNLFSDGTDEDSDDEAEDESDDGTDDDAPVTS